MEEQLKEIVTRLGEVQSDVDLDSPVADDLDIDSFRAAEIIFEIESALEISIPESRYDEIERFRDLIKLVREIKGA